MKTPRPHQTEAIKAVVKGFKSHARGKLIMACGTGKTLIAGWVREKLKATCTLFMAPSNALLAQTLQAWREVSKEPFEALAICCDATVAQDDDDNDDLPAASVGAAVTTDYQDIAKFISSSGRRVVLCTYQSSEALALAMSLVSVPEFDLAVADEAHRTTGAVDHLFPTIVHPDKIKATKKLFMTATPKFYFDGAETDIVSMDNEELYGPVFHELDFAEAIERGLLTDYEVLVVGVSPEATEEAAKLLDDNPRLKVGDRRMDAKNLAVHIALVRTIKERNLNRIITFHSSCPKASAAADFLPQLQDWMPKKYQTEPKLWARTVNHTMDIADRHELMRQFAALNGPGVLTNARCLGEGVDVPTVDGIAFMNAKKSKIDIAQSVGRAIRLSPGKQKSYIVLPVIMMPGDDPDQINNKSFKPAFDVINALRAHDSTLMDQLQHWRDDQRSGAEGGTGGDGSGDRRITFDIPSDCDPKIADWFVCRILNRQGSHEEWFLTLQRLKETLESGAQLTHEDVRWIQNQRARVDPNDPSKKLSPKRLALVSPLFDAIAPALPSPEDRAANVAKMFLADAMKNGYRAIKLGSVTFAEFTHKCTKFFTPSVKSDVEAILAFPTRARYKQTQRCKQRADKIDAFVAKHGVRPRVVEHSKLYSWLRASKKDPSLLCGVRDVEWINRVLTKESQDTARVAMTLRTKQLANKRLVKIEADMKAFFKATGHIPSRKKSASSSEFRLAKLLHSVSKSGADEKLKVRVLTLRRKFLFSPSNQAHIMALRKATRTATKKRNARTSKT